MKWKDGTSYSRGGSREQTAWVTNIGLVRVFITKAHIRNPGRWTMHAQELGIDTKDLGISSNDPVELAQTLALDLCRRKIDDLAASVRGFFE